MPTTLQIIARSVDPEGLRLDAETGSGFRVTLDSGEAGERRAGPGPMETVLVALAGCTSMDVGSILRKKRQPVASYEVAVSGERADEHPTVYTAITVEHRVTGDVEPEALRRSIELSATRYCPVSAMLSASVTVEHRYRLRRGQDEELSGLVAVTGPEGARVA